MGASLFRAQIAFLVCWLVLVFPPLFAADSGGEVSPWEEDPGEDVFFDDEYVLLEDEEGITIVETPETSQQIAFINKEEIEERNAADLATLLQETLNLGVSRYGGRGNMAGINLRGFDSKRIALLVDGIPVNSAMDGKINIDQIDLQAVERIEVISGGSDTKYNVSAAMGGVINIITVKKRKTGLTLGGSVSNTSALPGAYRDRAGAGQSPRWEDLADAQNISLGAAYGGSLFSLRAGAFANRAANHFIFTDRNKVKRRKDNNEVWDAGADASFIWDFPSLTKLILSSNFYYGDKNIPTSGFSPLFGLQRDLSTRHSLMLDMPRAFHDDLAAEASLTYSYAGLGYTSPAGVESLHRQNSVLAINRWSWYSGARLVLRGGFDYRFVYLDSTEIGNRNRHDGGVYLTGEFKPWEPLLVVPSVKAVMAGGGGIMPVPKLGLLLNIGDSLTLKNNYFRSFKFPDFEELYWNEGGSYGNPDLRPEDGWGADFGAAWRFRELFTLESVLFAQWTKDSIHWYANSDGIWRPENVGEAAFFGWDSKLRFEIPVNMGPVKKLIPSVSYQYLRSYLLSYGYDFSSEQRIPNMPAHTLGLSLDIPWATGSLLVSGHYESSRYTDTANLTELKSRFLLNLTVNQNIGERFTAFMALRNILNESYESYYDYPMPGFTFTLGIKARFEVP